MGRPTILPYLDKHDPQVVFILYAGRCVRDYLLDCPAFVGGAICDDENCFRAPLVVGNNGIFECLDEHRAAFGLRLREVPLNILDAFDVLELLVPRREEVEGDAVFVPLHHLGHQELEGVTRQ
eukprot:CAMPEP_0172609650 /NCGR_PEP_ID=MMETSP1068-20121228/29606_1 /TAXON_ID=35684 /ORGANISM="Pseudopedinella elastica, Strain CCMP716" /LENGTH=122 /DNA_ID=CAMNT_0013413211 /DNA_START=395 /DNA_END=760 /DNA_ORIENTATION=+